MQPPAQEKSSLSWGGLTVTGIFQPPGKEKFFISWGSLTGTDSDQPPGNEKSSLSWDCLTGSFVTPVGDPFPPPSKVCYKSPPAEAGDCLTEIKKGAALRNIFLSAAALFIILILLKFYSTLGNSSDRALSLASTAIDASVCVDLVLGIALSDSLNGTLSSAGTAADTSITNNTCHNSGLLS